jgi:hypothetical protein
VRIQKLRNEVLGHALVDTIYRKYIPVLSVWPVSRLRCRIILSYPSRPTCYVSPIPTASSVQNTEWCKSQDTFEMKTRINVFPWNFVFDLINSHAHLYEHKHTLLRKYAVDRRTRSISECLTNS